MLGTAHARGRHRASKAQAIELELAHIRERLEKLRHRMRSALGVGTVTALGVAAAALVVVALLAFVSFMGGDGGMGLLLGGAFTLGVPLTAVAAIGVGKPWWRASHEAAVLRQREKELHDERDDAVVAGEATLGDEYPAMASAAAGFATADRPAAHRARRSARYDAWDEGAPEFSSAQSPSDGSSAVATIADDVPLPLAEYSALSAASHVLGRAVRNTLTTESLTGESLETESTTARSEPTVGSALSRAGSVDYSPGGYRVAAEPSAVEAEVEADGADSSDRTDSSTYGQLVQATRPAQPADVRLAPHTPTWWEPNGRNRRARPHPAGPPVRRPTVSSFGLLVVAGVLVALFAIGVIAGVLTSS